jgi:RNA polymerase sigma-70 factor (ECF subfamily)
MDRLRRQYATPVVGSLDGEDPEWEPEPLDREADLAALELALDTLPLVEREALTLFYLRDLSLAELAETLNIPAGTVKSRLFRARKLLRTAMERRDA